MEIKGYHAKPWITVLLMAFGLISAISIWLVSVPSSTHAQEYCPSGQVVTAQSQCAGAVGPVDNLTKSILRLNGSGFYSANKIPISQQGVENNTERNSKVYSNVTATGQVPQLVPGQVPQPPSGLALGQANPLAAPLSVAAATGQIDQQKNGKNNTEANITRNTSANSNMTGTVGNMTAAGGNITAAGNMKKTPQPSQPLFQRQIPSGIPQYPAYQQPPTYPFQPYQQQQPSQPQPYQQPPTYPFSPYQQQQPSYNYPPPMILSQSAYTDSIGTVHIVGEVMNQSPVTAKFVEIVATYYSAYNQVVGTDFTYTEPHDLAPGQRAPLDLMVSSGIPTNQISHYNLSVNTTP